MTGDYEHKEWIPWYVDDAPSWAELSLAARGAGETIARKMRGGSTLELGSRGLRGLAPILGRPWDEVEPAIRELLAPGPDGAPARLVYDEENRRLMDPQSELRQRRARKSPAKSGAERTREWRSNRTGGGVTPVTDVTSPPSQTSPVTSRDVPSPSGSRSGSEGVPERGPLGEPTPSSADPPPPWFADVVAMVAQTTGESLRVAECWLRYAAHREGKPGKRAGPSDARYWLTSVMVPEARRERQQAARAGPAFARAEPPPAPYHAEFVAVPLEGERVTLADVARSVGEIFADTPRRPPARAG